MAVIPDATRWGSLQDHRDRKKARGAPPSVYCSFKHALSATTIVEGLFSSAKIVLSDLRNRKCSLPASELPTLE